MSEALWGVIAGGVVAILAAFIPQWWSHWQAKKTAKAVVGSYIKSILDIAEARKHAETGRGLLEALKQDPNQTVVFYGFDDDPMMDNALAHIGLLGARDAGDASVFLIILTATRIDLREMGPNGNFNALPVEQRVEKIKWNLAQWERAVKIGRDLVARLLR